MDSYPIHKASADERAQAVQVRIRVFVDIQGFPLEEEVDELDAEATHLVILDPAKRDGKVIGTLRIIHSGDAAKIGRVVILPEYQGKGLGRKLMEHAEQYVATNARYRECSWTKLGSQYDKRMFYEKCGYVARGDIYDDLGCPHVWMYKAIDRPEATAALAD
ncbi:acyl-CoA N-acyltransferase [Martensiomyces pterosporus]|nr:acyl-CoA N-acyltransferase [Martensiomyces pterosporus]